ncbi:hypothetical protein A3A07_01400 [Candidatus Nomurabacteria bacterium RIFCSPLOWO2_01_FULL_41_52]|nr:MAG: hypothetical protein A3A07_01400 [Candidatus Nomurabacteria bacterium RIFCSPLOWO2_01_FULL_41_52]
MINSPPNFWQKLKKPIFCLAPMADVTDCAFRQIIAKYSCHGGVGGGPDVFYTEFVSADGLAHPEAREKLLIDLKYSENERPIVAQIFGGKPENIRIASALCKKLGFDGIDINMGCPDKTIEKQCAGAAMMKNPKMARKIIRAAKEGAGGLPVSVKTRISYNPPSPKGFGRAGKNDYLLDEEWIKTLLKEDLAALIIHLRTRKEMSDVPAHWNLMKRIVEIRDEMGKETLILGNGDVLDLEDAKQKIKETSCDGIMLGRAIFGNPWLFANLACIKRNCQIEHPASDSLVKKSQILSKFKKIFSLATQSRNSAERSECVAFSKKSESGAGISIQEKLLIMIEHTKLFEKLLTGHKNFAVMKKHYKAYVNGFNGAKEFRMKLMEAENATQVEDITNDFLRKI